MAIKMRNNTKKDAICCECGDGQEDVLSMFDVCIGKTILTVCDICNQKLFYKCLHADVMVQSRTLTPREMRINRKREAKGIERW